MMQLMNMITSPHYLEKAPQIVFFILEAKLYLEVSHG